MPVTKKENWVFILQVFVVLMIVIVIGFIARFYTEHYSTIDTVVKVSQDDSRMLSSHADEAIANQQRMLAEAAKELECVRRTDGVLICRNRFVTTVAQSEVNCKITKTTADMVCEYKRK